MFCTRHACIQKHTSVCSQQQLVGQPLPLVQPSLDFFCNTHGFVLTATHMCVHTSSWSVNPLLTSSATHAPRLMCNSQLLSSATLMCVCSGAVGPPKVLRVEPVCAHSSNRSAKVFYMITASIDLCCTSQKHTYVCPQQQLVGQPLPLGCSPQLTSSATHMCVLDYSARHTFVFTAAIGRSTLS